MVLSNSYNTLKTFSDRIGLPLALFVSVLAVASYCLISFSSSPKGISTFWLTNGLPLAALLRAPGRRWPALIAAALCGNIGALIYAQNIDASLAVARSVSNVLQYAPCAYVFRKWCGEYFDIYNTKHVTRLAMLGIIATCMKIFAIIIFYVFLRPEIFFSINDLIYWIPNNFLGMFVLFFPLIAISSRSISRERRIDQTGWLIFILLAIASVVVFGGAALPAVYIIIPFLMLLAWRHGVFGAGIGSLLTIIVSSEAARRSLGIYHSLSLLGYSESVRGAHLELFFCASMLTCMPLAVLRDKQKVAEREIRDALTASEEREQMLTKSEGTLRTLESRWRNALEGSGLGVWDYDRTTGKVYLSPVWKAMRGFAESDLGDGLEQAMDLTHPDDRSNSWRGFDRADGSETGTFEFEERTRCKDGSYKWVLVRGVVLERDPDGIPTRFIGINTDIDAAKQASVFAERRTNLYFALAACHAEIAKQTELDELAKTICRVLVEHAGMKLVWIGFANAKTGLIETYKYYGEAADYIKGIKISTSADDELGRGPTGTAFRENRPVWVDDFSTDPRTKPWQERSKAFGWKGSAALPLRRKDQPTAVLTMYTGDLNYFDHDARTLLSGLAAQFSLAIDAFDAESARQEAEQRMQGMIDAAPLGIAVKDIQTGHYLDFNRKFAEIVGWSKYDLMAKRWQDITHLEDVAREAEMMGPFLAGETSSFQFEKRYVSQNGRIVWVSMTSARLTSTGQGQGQYLSMVEDVTERKALQQQLHLAQRMDAIGQLTGGVAHDFNNLLTVVIGGSEALLEQLEDPAQREYADFILQAAQQGGELARQLLAFARSQPLEPHVFEVTELLNSMAGLIKRTHGEDVLLSITQGAGPHFAYADPSQTEAAILNLCLNARDAMPQGGRLDISIERVALTDTFVQQHPEARPGDYVAISVSDTGTGIAPDVLEHIFEPFFTTKEVGKGTGMGLSMVYGFIKQSDGYLAIETVLGAGTTFTMYLPATDSLSAGHRMTSLEDDAMGGSENVLIVEDNDLVRRHASTLFESLGYHVTLAASGAEALAILAERDDIDLLFTDVIMPGGMNGRELGERATRLRPRLRVLYTSGYSRDALMEQGRLVENVMLLPKPFSKAQLSGKVRSVLDEVL